MADSINITSAANTSLGMNTSGEKIVMFKCVLINNTDLEFKFTISPGGYKYDRLDESELTRRALHGIIHNNISKLKVATQNSQRMIFQTLLNETLDKLQTAYELDIGIKHQVIESRQNVVVYGMPIGEDQRQPDNPQQYTDGGYIKYLISNLNDADAGTTMLKSWVDNTDVLFNNLDNLRSNTATKYRLTVLNNYDMLGADDAIFTDTVAPWEFDLHLTDVESHKCEMKQFLHMFVLCLIGNPNINGCTDNVKNYISGVSACIATATYNSNDTRNLINNLRSLLELESSAVSPFDYTNKHHEKVQIILTELYTTWIGTFDDKHYVMRASPVFTTDVTMTCPIISYAHCNENDYWMIGDEPSIISGAIKLVFQQCDKILNHENIKLDREDDIKRDIRHAIIYTIIDEIISKNKITYIGDHTLTIYNNNRQIRRTHTSIVELRKRIKIVWGVDTVPKLDYTRFKLIYSDDNNDYIIEYKHELNHIFEVIKMYQIKQGTLKTNDYANLLMSSFVGWHHGTMRAANRTVHAIATGPFYTKIYDHYKNLESKNICYMKTDDNPIGYELLEYIVKDTSSTQTVLVEPAPVIVHGPSQNSVATKCHVDGIYCTTPAFDSAIGNLWSMIYNISNTINMRPHPDSLLFLVKQSQFRQHKRQRLDTAILSPTLDTLLNLSVVKSDRTLLPRCIRSVDTVYTMTADGGKRYRHQMPAQMSTAMCTNLIRQLLINV